MTRRLVGHHLTVRRPRSLGIHGVETRAALTLGRVLAPAPAQRSDHARDEHET
jgi:hypothetical protein